MKLRSHLILLVVTALLPVIIFAGVMIYAFSKQEQAAVERGLLDTARALSLAVDRELEAGIRVLQALATSEHLETGDVKHFYDQAGRALKTQQRWDTIALFDSGERQLLNLLRPFGSPMPPPPSVLALGIKDAIELKRPIISNLFVGRVSGELRIAVIVPLIRNGGTKYVVAAATPPTFLVRLLTQQKIPPDWLATIIDRNQIIIARTRNFEKYLGKLASPTFAAKIKEAKEVAWRGVTLEGVEVYSAASRSELSGWTVGLAVPSSIVEAPLKRSIMITAVGGLALLLLGIVFATFFGRRIATSIASLSNTAEALVGEDPAASGGGGQQIAEVRQVARAMEDAAAERKQAEKDLQARYKEFQSLHEIGQTVLNSLDLKSILEGILDKALSIGSFDIGNIRLLDPKSKFLQVVASRGYRNTGDHKSHSINPKDPTAAGLQIAAFNSSEAYTVENVPATPGLRTLKREGVHSASLIPIRAEDQILGTILLGSRTARKFPPHEVRLLETLGSQLGIAVQKALLHEETQQNLARIRALHEIDRAITSTLDLPTVLEVLLEKIDLVLPYAATTVRLLNKESGLLEPVACRNLNEEEWKTERWRGGRGIPNVAFESRAPVTISNVQTDPQNRDQEFFRKHGLVSYLGVPLITKDNILGVISFYTKEEHEFTNEEIEFLETMAGQAAIAINNSQLYEETSRSKRELELTNQYLENSIRQLSSLYTALTPLAPSESTHAMMDGIIERLMEATGADAALIRLWDKTSRTLVRASQRGFPDFYLVGADVRPPGGATDWVFENGEPIIAPDIAADPRLKGKVQLKAGFCSCAILPLKVHQEVRGIIHISSRKFGYFDEEQRDHLMAIARQMGIALENKDLFDNLRASRDDLEKANKIKDEFLSVMSHELRTPLNVVVGYSGMIKDGLLGKINPRQQEALEKVINRTHDQLTMINNILDATVLESEKINIESQEVSLPDLLNQVRLSYEAPINKEVILNWDYPSDLPVMKTDSGKLKQLMQNLIDNAIKFTRKGSVTISANIRHEATGERQQEEGLLAPHASRLTPSDPHASRLKPS